MEENQPFEINFEGEMVDLQSLAVMRITIELWKQVNVVNAMEHRAWKFYVQPGETPINDEFETLTNIVKENLTQLKLSNILREKCANLIKQIGLHICEWIDLTQPYPPYLYTTQLVKSIAWTIHGNVDKYKSFDMWLHNLNELPNISDHWHSFFSLACCFCVENHIRNIWNLVPKDSRETFCNYSLLRADCFLINYWISFEIRGLKSQFVVSLQEFWNVHSFLQNVFTLQDYRIENIASLMFVHAAMFKYSVAAKYFCTKLTANDKEKYLPPCLRFLLLQNCMLDYRELREHVDIIQYLFSKTERLHQVNIFREFMNFFLMIMVIRWPYQKFLSRLIQQTWTMLRINILCRFFQYISFKILEGKFVERFLIENIWNAVNNYMKRAFFSFVSVAENISHLYVLEKNVIETFSYIMKDSTIVERNTIYSLYEI